MNAQSPGEWSDVPKAEAGSQTKFIAGPSSQGQIDLLSISCALPCPGFVPFLVRRPSSFISFLSPGTQGSSHSCSDLFSTQVAIPVPQALPRPQTAFGLFLPGMIACFLADFDCGIPFTICRDCPHCQSVSPGHDSHIEAQLQGLPQGVASVQVLWFFFFFFMVDSFELAKSREVLRKQILNNDASVRVCTTAQPWRGLAAPSLHSLTDLFSALC